MRAHTLLLLTPFSLCACLGGGGPPELEDAVAELGADICRAEKLEAFSTSVDEGRLVFSVDGKHAYFHRAGGAGLQILESRRLGDTWTPPAPVSFGSNYIEFDPFLSIDGNTLYYTSFRPADGGTGPARADGDLWKVTRTGEGWGAPVRLGPEVNTDANEFFPSVTADGTLYFNSDRAGGVGAWDLYRARRAGAGFAAAAGVPGEVNTPIWEFNPSLTPGGHFLAFGSLDPTPSAPLSDVFFSVRRGAGYSPRVNAGPCINTDLAEFHPTIDWARNRLVFVRFSAETKGDLYAVSLTAALLELIR